MKAVQLDQNLKLKIAEIEKPIIGKDQSLVKLKSAALNKRDHWITKGLYPGIQPNITLGSDGCGEVIEGDPQFIGKEVVINPNCNWGSSEVAQASKYSILGMPLNGTLAEYIAIDNDKILLKPEHLSTEEAAALPLAGMTAYRACFTRGEAKSNDKVLITGAGGGVAQLAISFCLAVHSEVYVTSGTNEKIDKCKSKGVKGGYNYKNEDWLKQVKTSLRGFDLIVDSAGGKYLNEYLSIIKPGGNIVLYGGSAGKTPKFDVHRLFWSQANVKGSSMASDKEFIKMLEFVSENKITPYIDAVYELNDFHNAFARFDAIDHLGKIVITF